LEFNSPLLSGILLKRYKRFLADIKLDDGTYITAHCPNSGSMKTCKEPGWKVLVSKSSNPKRKLKYTWEMVHNGICWIGINTQIPNIIAKEAILGGKISELRGYENIQTEVRYGQNSRVDLLLKRDNELCYVEVKNVTLVVNDSFRFPDAVTTRGQKHLDELCTVLDHGDRAVMFFVVQRSDATYFTPATQIDPDYARKLKVAHEHGVEILVYRADVFPQKIELSEKINFIL
jgi:sugar fermentation stimulation protein A